MQKGKQIFLLAVLILLEVGVGYLREKFQLTFEGLNARSQAPDRNDPGHPGWISALAYTCIFFVLNWAIVRVLLNDRKPAKIFALLHLPVLAILAISLTLGILFDLQALMRFAQVMKEFLQSPLPFLVFLPLLLFRRNSMRKR